MGFVFNKFKMEINLVSSLVASSSFSSGAKNNQNLEIKYSFIYGGLSVGRVLVRSRNSVWSILGGIGVFESSLLLLQKTNTNFNFNQLLTTSPPGQSPLLKHISGCFEISIEYMSCPSLEGRVVILSDPMLATGASIVKTIAILQADWKPATIHVVCAIASTVGIEFIERECGTNIKIWCGDIDDELTAKGYIVPGLGDAGDLA
ncbi:MAG: hypothetical protein EAZ80_01045, partial [Runella slithyformis]